MKKILQPLFHWSLQDQTFSRIVWSSKEGLKPSWMSLELQWGFGKLCCSPSVHAAEGQVLLGLALLTGV